MEKWKTNRVEADQKFLYFHKQIFLEKHIKNMIKISCYGSQINIKTHKTQMLKFIKQTLGELC